MVCPGDVIVWDGQHNKFEVQFTQGCPLTDGCRTKINDGNPSSVPVVSLPNLTNFKYKIRVNGGHLACPHVVGGGGHLD